MHKADLADCRCPRQSPMSQDIDYDADYTQRCDVRPCLTDLGTLGQVEREFLTFEKILWK